MSRWISHGTSSNSIKRRKESTQPTSPAKQNATAKKLCWVGIRKRLSAAIENEEKKIQIKHERREHALAEISATIELDKKEAILAKLKVDEDMEDLDELAELETKLFCRILIAE